MVWLFAATAPEELAEGGREGRREGRSEETRASTHCHRKSTACTRRHTWTGEPQKNGEDIEIEAINSKARRVEEENNICVLNHLSNS